MKWARRGADLFIEAPTEPDGLRHPTSEEFDALIASWKLLEDCPLGIYDGKVIASRTMSEEILAAWVLRIYEVKESCR